MKRANVLEHLKKIGHYGHGQDKDSYNGARNIRDCIKNISLVVLLILVLGRS